MRPFNPSSPARRVFHAYAALCVLAGLSGTVLSLWVHPENRVQRLQLAAVQSEDRMADYYHSARTLETAADDLAARGPF